MSERAVRFDRAYSQNPDPWDFATSPYEQAKYRTTIEALPRAHYRSAIEVGCSIGELTRLLAQRCDRVTGIEVSAIAVEEARLRNAQYENISFLQCEIPEEWPDIEADLIVLSEVLYYLTPAEIEALAERICERFPVDGDCVLVNYLGNTGEELQGVKAAKLFIRAMVRRIPSLHHNCPRGSRLRWALIRNIPWSRRTSLGGGGYRIDILRNSPVRSD